MRTGLIAVLTAASLALSVDAHAEEPTPPEVDSGWSMTGGFVSIPASILFGLGLTFDVATLPWAGDSGGTVVSWVATAGVVAIAAPIIELGARSAHGVRGSPVARIIGWTAYAALMADSIVVPIGAVASCSSDPKGWSVRGNGWCTDAGDTLMAQYIFALPILGVTAIAAFTVDAFASASQAHRAMRHSTRGAALVPVLTPVRGGALGGIGGVF